MQNLSNPWLIRPRPVHNPRFRLFCFPYAGGSASIYFPWCSVIARDVEVIAIQYPGRANRLGDTPYKHLNELLNDVESAISPLLDRPYVFFGHSMGAVIAYELTRSLGTKNILLPMHLFVSGHSAPQLPPKEPPRHHLPDDEFFETLRELNGTPAEVLENRELMELMLPIIRADFQMIETWKHESLPMLEIPISVFGGIADKSVPSKELSAWVACSTARVSCHIFPGDHFFLHKQYPEMIKIISHVFNRD